jgi:regulator of RNase E activity RraA
MSTDERLEILNTYNGLRVADVRDGMDWNMMHNYGSVHYSIRALFRTCVVGIANTSRYVPYEQSVPQLSPDEYTEWKLKYGREVSRNPGHHKIEEGDFICIDQSEVSVGIIGSSNGLEMFSQGARGFVTNGGVRDSDELFMQKTPVWSKFMSQGMVQGRIRFDANDVPISIGGVVINPGDIIVADGDGVVVVPRKMAFDVAKYAWIQHDKDKARRREKYERLGWELDSSVSD